MDGFNIIRARGANCLSIIVLSEYGDEMISSAAEPAHDHTLSLRPRQCCEPSCGAMFSVCTSCDRGQRYCSEACRTLRRQQQLRAAGKRYQASEAGRRAHCHRQQAYSERNRVRVAPMTHQALAPIMTSRVPIQVRVTACAICGVSSHWLNPFYLLVPPRRIRHRSAKVHFPTLS